MLDRIGLVWSVTAPEYEAGFVIFDVAEVHHFPAAAPDQSDLFGDHAVQLIAPHGPRIFFADDQLAVAQERVVGSEAVLVIALERRRIGDVAPHLRKPVLPLRTPITLKQRHFITVLLAHDLVDEQQTRSEVGIEHIPVAARVFQRWPDLLDFLRGEYLGRKWRRWNQLFA